MMAFSSDREKRLWISAFLVLVAIYGSIGFAPAVSGFLRENGMIVPLFMAGIAMIPVAIIAAGLKWKLRSLEIAVVVGIAAAYLLLLVRIEIPEERTHILEYGVLALFIHEALIERFKKTGRNLAASIFTIVLVSLLGVTDEVLQYFWPQRVFDLRDILFNSLAVVMAVCANALLGWARKKARRTNS